MRLYNTSSKTIEIVSGHKKGNITFYSCGPTVYDNTHIGHLRTFVNNDLLKRALQFERNSVNHVMNITDVGHLTGDDDSGEDKLEKGAKKYNQTVWEVAKHYTDQFKQSLVAVNITVPNTLCRATDHVRDMILLIQQLQKNGFAYETDEAVYFDTSLFPHYGELSGQKLEDKIQKARNEVNIDSQKKHPADFALWFKRVGRFANHSMHWLSPWGEGFPGWHIECSAMSMKYLGSTIDIHAGGIDHIPVHHENEIAQSEAATGKKFVSIWFHNNFLLVEGLKMSKSIGNITTIDDIIAKKYDPLALRYLFLQTHYRQLQNFTWESLSAAQTAFTRLKQTTHQLKKQTERSTLSEEKLLQITNYKKLFETALQNDLQIPQALSIVWDMLKSNIPSLDKYDLLISFDEVLGLKLSTENQVEEELLPAKIQDLINERNTAKTDKDFTSSDSIRKELESEGYNVSDTSEGTVVTKKN